MSAAQNEWVQPVAGKKVTWRHLKVGDQMDLDANYSRSDVAHLKKYAAYALRIISVDGAVAKFQVNDFRTWDEYDLEAFAEEVALRDLARAHALSSERPGSPIADLERKIESAQLAASALGEALRNVMAAARSTEQALGPLNHSASSSS